MVRPKKMYRFKSNGDSLQFFINSEYVGSLPIKNLCLLAKTGDKPKLSSKHEAQDKIFSEAFENAKKEKEINYKTRKYLLMRLGECCVICGNEDVLDLHHIVPRSQGGSDDLDNLVVLCPNHHSMYHRGMLPKEDLICAKMKAKNLMKNAKSTEAVKVQGSVIKNDVD